VAFSPSLYASRLHPPCTRARARATPRESDEATTQPRTTQFRSANETTAADEIGHFDENKLILKKK